ncbi:MAG TPA: flagellar basal body rod protein FlgB [Fimbriimonadaceae bacterium]|nr:flagellar basal body rod protein FlgB [Fimbriimonadaceae bacterium]
MGLLDAMYSPTLDAMQYALSLATKRETMLHANLANANTPGYKRKDLDFNVSLDEALGRETPSHIKDMSQQVRQAISDQTSITGDGNNVDMEREVQGIAETQLRFSALSQMAASYFSDLKSAIREGK